MTCLSVLQFAVLSLVILPLLPDRDHGTYGALNPYQIWWMVVLISGVSLAGYAALRLIGQRRGALALGVLGGLVSSTATTFAFSRHARSGDAMARIDIVTLAILSNIAFKLAVAFVLGGWNMARHAIAGMGAIAIGLIAAWAVLRVL
jgi:uncharacterized membrane protein (DUF4010 family)